jgi:hypothetical protein
MLCNNALYPDLYGHYREAKFTQTKHHWWWKANRVFNQLEVTRNHTGTCVQLAEGYILPHRYVCSIDGKLYTTTQVCLSNRHNLYTTTQVCLFNWLEVIPNHTGMSVQPAEVIHNHTGTSVQLAEGYILPNRYVCSIDGKLYTTTQVCLFNWLKVIYCQTGTSVQLTGSYTQPHRYVGTTG